MRLRHAVAADEAELADFPIAADNTAWLVEVRELVTGLIEWREGRPELDRQVVVLEDEHGHIVAVAAHEAEEDVDGRVFPDSRYLMVTAVHADRRRTGLARLLVQSVLADMQRNGADYVSWLVHPDNRASLAFAHAVFTGIEETYPPEDRPYARFLLTLQSGD